MRNTNWSKLYKSHIKSKFNFNRTINYESVSSGFVTWWRFNNDSSFTLREVHCVVNGYLDGKSLGAINMNVGNSIVVHPGESTMSSAVGSLTINSDGSLPFEKIGISYCKITVGETRQVKKIDESIKLEFIEFKDDHLKPTIKMSLTHSLSEPIRVQCYKRKECEKS